MSIIPNRTHCLVMTILFEMIPSEDAEPCTLQLGLVGMTKDIDFQVSYLRSAKHISNTLKGGFQACEQPQSVVIDYNVRVCLLMAFIEEKPTMVTLSNLVTQKGNINIIEESANSYHCIGTILLNDRYGKQVNIMKLKQEEIQR